MRPLAILTGFVLGSAVSITFSMAVVGLLLMILVSDYPQVRGEIRPLLTAAGLFLCLTIAAGLSFIGLLREQPWWWLAQLVMWVILGGTVLYFLPD
ncbi:MAG: hypothetical protein OER80_12195 [Gammaproteobacteria bacterium]|nr:hypothetical protein [Gammaproteobacteria bacterium]MDH3769352.1 hypothetical protein [Gammaproteobacteria bacterium]